MPAELAARITDIPVAAAALDATLVAEKAGVDGVAAATTIFALESRFDLADLRAKALAIRASDPYERLALDRALAASDEAMRRIAIEIIGKHGAGGTSVAAWVATKGDALTQTLGEVRRLASGTLNQAKLTVLAGILGDLARG